MSNIVSNKFPRFKYYRLRSASLPAIQWFKNGDHPDDNCPLIPEFEDNVPDAVTASVTKTEGRVIRYFRHPTIPGDTICPDCGKAYHEHGFIESELLDEITGEYSVHSLPINAMIKVCPGEWILTTASGKYIIIKDEIFKKLYELDPTL